VPPYRGSLAISAKAVSDEVLVSVNHLQFGKVSVTALK
jgi:hypothetical protein